MDTATKETIRNNDMMVIDQRTRAMYYSMLDGDDTGYLFYKRIFDIVVSSLLIVGVLSWLYPILALLINISSKGGTLFIQKRVGMNGRTFKCFKFRTMVVNEECDRIGATLYDRRITRIGKWLRASYIDELPQLINVWMGDMSITGPRPHMLYHHQKFSRDIPYYEYRHLVKPGITGLAQIKGYHGVISGRYHIYGRTRLDLFYVQNASFNLDMMILLGTVNVLFSRGKKTKNKKSGLQY